MKLKYFLLVFALTFGESHARLPRPDVVEVVEMAADEQGFIVPGIHKENLPQPIFYEGYIPLVLEYQTPKWNKTEITFNNWYKCLSETVPYRYSCPVVFHMNQAVVNLHVDFEGLHPAMDTDSPHTEEITQMHYDRLTTSSKFCSEIQKHFSGIYTNASDMENYLEALKRCRIEWLWNEILDVTTEPTPLFIERNLSDFNYAIRAPFTRMENNFYTTFYKAIIAPDAAINTTSSTPTTSAATPTTTTPSSSNSKMDMVASALLSNTRTTLQAGILGVYYAEKNRWIHATSDCIQQLIPQSIVTKTKFAEKLKLIDSMKFFQSKYELSISPNLVSKYYSLPLTDCSHTSANTMVVRIQIPIVKKDRPKTLQLVHTHTIPFAYKEHVCRIKLSSQLDHTPSGFFQQVHGSHYLYEALSGLAFPTDCKSNELCKISEYGVLQRTFADRCASALMARNHSVIRNHCQFQCKKQDLSETPLVTRIHSNQYVITGSPLEIAIKCKGIPKNGTGSNGTFTSASTTTALTRQYSIDPDRVGAYLVNLPCNCYMTLENSKLKLIRFYGEGACNTGGNKAATKNYFYSPEGVAFNAPQVIPIIPFHFARMKDSSSSESSFYYEHLSPDSKVNLADFIDLERVDGFLANFKGDSSPGNKRGVVGGTGSYFIPEGGVGAEQLVLEGGSSVTWLWVVFIITTLVLFTIQVYILYLLRNKERLSYSRDERILYKPSESPDEEMY